MYEPNLPGIYSRLSNEDYHKSPGMSKSGLWELDKRSAAHYKFGDDDQTKSQRLGEIVHAAILEPQLIGVKYIPGPKINKNTKEWKAALEAAAQSGRTLCDVDEYTKAMKTAERLHADPTMAAILAAKPLIEHSAFAVDPEYNALVRCRPDLAITGLLGDVKSIADASGDGPQKAIQSYAYAFQAFMYSRIWKLAGGGDCPFLFIFVEPYAPFEFRLIEPDEEFLEIGQKIYHRAMAKYVECQRQNVWPGYAKGVEKIGPSRWFASQFKTIEE